MTKITTKRLKGIEVSEIEFIAKNGLVMRVIHEKYDEPKEIVRDKGRIITVIGITTVELYVKESLERIEGKGYQYDRLDPFETGVAFCSVSEQTYDKREGRVRATAKALHWSIE